MSAILNLYRLQQIDTQIDHANHRLEVIAQILAQDAELAAAQQKYAAAQTDQQTAESRLRQVAAEAEAQKIKIEQAESNLYSGRIQNPKELQDLQNDVAALKRHLAALEDRQLEAMLTLEEAQTNYQNARLHLHATQAQIETKHAALTSERDALRQQLARLDVERQAVYAAIPAADLAEYQQIRRQRHGIAVTTISDGACDSCGAPLPPGLSQQSKTRLTHCPACGRILFNSR